MSNLDRGFYAIAATGAAGSQSNYWGEVVSVTKSGSSYLTGKYWPASDPGLTSFYASNVSPTFAASGPTVTLADCNTDVVCAHAASPTYGVNCPLTFNHVLARVGTITLNTKSGYELSAVTATLKNGVTGGTYNLRTGAWSSLGAGSDKSTGAFSGNTSAQASDNDIWLIPGTYTISLSYTLTKGDYVYNAVNKTGSVTILAGNTNNITTTAVGVDATEIVFSVSLTAWSPNSVALALDHGVLNGHEWVDLGLRLGGNKILIATCNIGAENPWDYGDYFMWADPEVRYSSINHNTGKITGFSFSAENAPYGSSYGTLTKYCTQSGFGVVDNKTILDDEDNAAVQLWGGGWDMMTEAQFNALYSLHGDQWVSNYNSTGVSGCVIRGKGSFSASEIFLPDTKIYENDTRNSGSSSKYRLKELHSEYCSPYYMEIYNSSYPLGRSYTSSAHIGMAIRPVLIIPE